MTNRKLAFASLIAVFLILAAFTLPPVRAAASDFLGLFRVQKFAAISVSPGQLARLEQIMDEGLYPGEIQMIEEPGAPQAMPSLAAAEAASGQSLRTLGELGAPGEIYVTSGGSGRLIVDLESARRILELAEVDPKLLPDSLDGANVDVTIFAAVEQHWAEDNVMLLQSQSPLVDYPEDANTSVLGQALLQLLGMAPGEARRLASSIDWTNTLLLPVPENFATFSEVRVNGASGLALSSVDGYGSSLMWQQDGNVYLLVGDGDIAGLAGLAESLR